MPIIPVQKFLYSHRSKEYKAWYAWTDKGYRRHETNRYLPKSLLERL